MREIKAILRRDRLEHVVEALHEIPGLPGLVVSPVQVYARLPPGQIAPLELRDLQLCKLEAVVPMELVEPVTRAIESAAHTGRPGDGMVFVIPVEDAIRIGTGARGLDAL